MENKEHLMLYAIASRLQIYPKPLVELLNRFGWYTYVDSIAEKVNPEDLQKVEDFLNNKQ